MDIDFGGSSSHRKASSKPRASSLKKHTIDLTQSGDEEEEKTEHLKQTTNPFAASMTSKAKRQKLNK